MPPYSGPFLREVLWPRIRNGVTSAAWGWSKEATNSITWVGTHLKRRYLKRQCPSAKESFVKYVSLWSVGAVFCCDKVVRSKLVCMPKGLGQEKANISFAEYRKSPSVFILVILHDRHAYNSEGVFRSWSLSDSPGSHNVRVGSARSFWRELAGSTLDGRVAVSSWQLWGSFTHPPLPGVGEAPCLSRLPELKGAWSSLELNKLRR